VFQNVNKVKLNEAFGQGLNPQSVLNVAFNDLKSGVLGVEQSKTQANNNESYVELICIDKEGNNITFTFKAQVQEGDQEGVFDITDIGLETFSFDSARGDEEAVELSGDVLKQFNMQHKNEMLSIVDKYIDEKKRYNIIITDAGFSEANTIQESFNYCSHAISDEVLYYQSHSEGKRNGTSA
jgi:hypothetical protein